MQKTVANIIRIFIILFVFVSASLGYALFKATLTEWWIPVCLALIFIVATLPFYRKWAFVTTTTGRLTNMMCHILCVGSIGYTFFIAGNFFFRDTNKPEEAVVSIVHKYTEMQERRKRIGRHHHYTTTKTRKYYIEVSFADGKTKTLDVSLAFYNKTKGDTLRLTLEKGLWGFPVIRQYFKM